jgi:hypothetical protein
MNYQLVDGNQRNKFTEKKCCLNKLFVVLRNKGVRADPCFVLFNSFEKVVFFQFVLNHIILVIFDC